MPFANLRDGDWRRRDHGIRGATTADSAPPSEVSVVAPPPRLKTPAKSAVGPAQGADGDRPVHVTAADIEAGRIRVPGGAKSLLPDHRTELVVVLRGEILGDCRWDPRYGPPERSGVIGIGKATARRLLNSKDVLALRVASDCTVEID